MFILLLIFALIRHLHGAPTGVPSVLSCDPLTNVFTRDDPVNSHLGTRQISDIILSCFATIFACTWTAVHPNIPGPCDSGWEIFKRQVTTMIYAVLAPEAMTGWALRQNLAARKVERPGRSWRHRQPLPPALGKEQGVAWTITHGFFAQLGGLILSKDGRPEKVVIQPSNFVAEGRISPPTITEAEIQDRSKGDGLSKTVVVLQTTWFIAQCIVRWSSGLAVTELEVVTLGFAMLNLITYGLWWDKPQSVGLPVYLEVKESKEGSVTEPGDAVVNQEDIKEGQDTEQVGNNVEGERPSEENTERADGQTPVPVAKEEVPISKEEAPIVKEEAPIAKEEALIAKQSFLTKKLKKELGSGWQQIWRIPYRLVRAAFHPLSRMMHFSDTRVGDRDGDLRVPMFFSAAIDSNAIVFTASSVFASIFGLIHLIPAWFLHFPSRPEMFLWRISAGIITAHPIVLGIWSASTNGNLIYGLDSYHALLFAYTGLSGLPLYIIARLAILILALLSLRTLDNNALLTVDWISFIPHL